MDRALSSSVPDPPAGRPLSLSIRLALLLLLPLLIVLLLSFLLPLLSIWVCHNRRRRHSLHNRQQPEARQTVRDIRGLRR